MGYSFYYPPENKVIVAQNAEFFENSLITQEVSGSLEDIEVIQEEDTTCHALDRMYLHVDAEEHELGYHNEHTNYKVELSDPESEKWLEVMNMEMQSVKDNQCNKKVFNPKYLNQVCKLKCSVYGLNQALRQWNKRIDDEIKKFRFTQNHDESCVYVKSSGSNFTFLILYVDDILIMRNHIPMLQGVKSYLGKCFAIKDLGEAAYILRFKIYKDRSRQLIRLCQSAYIKKILKRLNMENSKRGNVPMQEMLRLSKTQGASTPNEVKHMKRVPCALARSAKQSIIATSSIESEYMAASEASKIAIWIRKFISGLGVVPTNEEPMKIYCDNTGAITIANEP
ncbi:putative retrotransposon protein [Tanacetum coccineum]